MAGSNPPAPLALYNASPVLRFSCQTCPGPAGPVSTVTTRRGKKQRPQMGGRGAGRNSTQSARCRVLMQQTLGAARCAQARPAACAGRTCLPREAPHPHYILLCPLRCSRLPRACLATTFMLTGSQHSAAKNCQSAAENHIQGNGLHPAARRVTGSSRLRNARPGPAAATPTSQSQHSLPCPPHPTTARRRKFALTGPALAHFARWEKLLRMSYARSAPHIASYRRSQRSPAALARLRQQRALLPPRAPPRLRRAWPAPAAGWSQSRLRLTSRRCSSCMQAAPSAPHRVPGLSPKLACMHANLTYIHAKQVVRTRALAMRAPAGRRTAGAAAGRARGWSAGRAPRGVRARACAARGPVAAPASCALACRSRRAHSPGRPWGWRLAAAPCRAWARGPVAPAPARPAALRAPWATAGAHPRQDAAGVGTHSPCPAPASSARRSAPRRRVHTRHTPAPGHAAWVPRG